MSSGSVVKLIIAVLILLAIVVPAKPEILFFLSDAQKNSIAEFSDKYIGQLPASLAGLNITIGMIISVIFMIFAMVAAYQIIALIFRLINFKNRRAETLKRVTLNAIRYIVIIAAVIWALMILGVNIGAIFAGVGILALVISLGAQSLFADIFTGLFIIAEGQYQVGDIISIDGFRGSVVSLGIRTTRIMDVGGNVKIVNNSDVRNVLNLSEQNSYAVCDIGIAYGASIEAAEKSIADTVAMLMEKYPEIFHTAPEYAGVQELADSAIVLRVLAKVDEPDIFRARRLLNREVKLGFDRDGIEIPFPQVVVHKAEK